MRPLALSLLLASAPAAAAAQGGPRCLSLELGFTRDSAEELGDRAPVALSTAWWLTGDLDATARVTWGFASRTGGRRAAGSFEAVAGLRYALGTLSVLRPQLVVDLAFVQVFGAPAAESWTSDSGVRLGAGAALEVFFARELSLSLTARATELALVSGDGGPGLAVALGVAAYF
jgi:hypothetical protein